MMQADTIFAASTHQTEDDYTQIVRFAQANNNITYTRFDGDLLSQVNLFALPENFDFNALNNALSVIIRTLPAIKRIFSKPITHIKTMSEILPVESVRVINNETVVHALVHSELWENITRDGLKPRRLLTQDNQDNYAIYENLVFTKAIDMILSFVHKNIRFLNNVLYANRDLQFNLLERENHLMYFLSIGKFHAGYVRDYAKYRALAEGCMEKALFIERVIGARLNSPVYKKCKSNNQQLTLKKTNIFRMDKEYHKIYLLLKWFSDFSLDDINTENTKSAAEIEGYSLYCSMLSLFAAAHFNFVFPQDEKIDFYNPNIECSFDAWKLKFNTVECDGQKALKLTVFKDVTYSVLLLPAGDVKAGQAQLARFSETVKADEYLVASSTVADSSICLSLSDINSFRRVQQIILRAMVYSDKRRDVCPFCGQSLSKYGDESEGFVFECNSCRTQIVTYTCTETGESYFVTKIKNFTPQKEDTLQASRKEKITQGKRTEAHMYFRNITPIEAGAKIVCPKCGRIHQ